MITGLREAAIRSETIPPPSRGTPPIVSKSTRSAARVPSVASNVLAPRPRSAPAQKPTAGAGQQDGAHVVVGVGRVEGSNELAGPSSG